MDLLVSVILIDMLDGSMSTVVNTNKYTEMHYMCLMWIGLMDTVCVCVCVCEKRMAYKALVKRNSVPTNCSRSGNLRV
jgi:hypothetical protein